MIVSFSSVIDWNLNSRTVSEEEALAGLTEASRQRVERLLAEYAWCKLSFGYSDEDAPGEHWADFTPRRCHPLARDYGRWITQASTMDEAIAQAEGRFHNLMAVYTMEG